MRANVCGTCEFMEEGFCKRYPPRMLAVEERVMLMNPEVTKEQWCGEYKPSMKAWKEGER